MRILIVKMVSWFLGGAKVANDVKHYMDVFYFLGFVTGFMLGSFCMALGVWLWHLFN